MIVGAGTLTGLASFRTLAPRLLLYRSRKIQVKRRPLLPKCEGTSLKCSHCKEDSIYVFPEKKLRGLSPNFHIHVSVSDLYIPGIGPPIFLQQNRQTGRENIPHRNMNVGFGNEAARFISGNICFKFSDWCLCSAGEHSWGSPTVACGGRLVMENGK